MASTAIARVRTRSALSCQRIRAPRTMEDQNGSSSSPASCRESPMASVTRIPATATMASTNADAVTQNVEITPIVLMPRAASAGPITQPAANTPSCTPLIRSM